MRSINSIKKNKDFQKVYERKNSKANRILVMYVMNTGLNVTRIGISVSKKVGNSVVRHRVIRLIRECCRLHKQELKEELDIIIVARPMAKGLGYREMESAFLHIGSKHNILKESK